MNARSESRYSIRFQLVLAVNGVLLLLVGAFVVYDYFQELNDRFDEKKTALEEEAKTLLPGCGALATTPR